jgi:DNA-directed RNA polymerase subunit RPC12/RpoP
MTSYRCDACGNKTRFDVFESKRVRAFHHFTLGGEVTIEEEEVLERSVERVVCRWCGSADAVVEETDQDPARENA